MRGPGTPVIPGGNLHISMQPGTTARLTLALVALVAAGCRPRQEEDYAVARRAFQTKLVREDASPQPWSHVPLPSSAQEIEFSSGGRQLRAWLSIQRNARAARAPAVLLLHGGFAFSAEDWDMTRAFRDAGFVVMTPILRGENGSPGVFSLFYDEVDDVLAAADVLAKQPTVDARRIYVSGHSVGGTLAMLAALTSQRFRAAAPLSGIADPTIVRDWPLVPFDPEDDDELRMRSTLAFATSFKCPARLYFGEEEAALDAPTRETARLARASGLDVQAVAVPGGHVTMTTLAIPMAIAFFEQHR